MHFSPFNPTESGHGDKRALWLLQQRRAVPTRSPMRHVGSSVRRALGPLRARVKGSVAALRLNWPDVAGKKLARLSAPMRLIPRKNGAVLVVGGESAAAALIHHAGPIIRERAGLICGTPIASLRIVHGGVDRTLSSAPRPSARDSAPTLPNNALAAALISVKNERVRDSLAKLGALVAASNNNKPTAIENLRSRDEE